MAQFVKNWITEAQGIEGYGDVVNIILKGLESAESGKIRLGTDSSKHSGR
jgi:hypothetical protein